MFKSELFESQWNNTTYKPLSVYTTWGRKQENVYIIRHTQRIGLCEGVSLCQCSDMEAALWDTKMKLWSTQIAKLQETFERKSSGHGKAFKLDDPMPSPHYIEQGTGVSRCVSWFNMTTLSPSTWVDSLVIEAYMSLIQQKFPSIHFRYVPDFILDVLAQDVRPGRRTDKWQHFKDHNEICKT